MSTATPPPVRLVSIGKRYSGTKALDDVSVEVTAGSVHALVGANGAGKSTLGKIVGGVVRPDEGQLFVDGRPVRYASPRDARIDGIATIAQETEESLVAGMFGAAAEAEHFDKPQGSTAPVVLAVSGLHRRGVLRDISLQIRAGEIVGLAGLVGSGRTELARAIAGADPIDGGTIAIDGRPRHIRSSADAMAAGMAFLPESRKDDGLFLGLSIAANTTFADLRSVAGNLGVLSLVRERSRTRELLDLTSVQPPNPSAKVGNLSGGNQQKVLFARWLFRDPRVLILDEPTRGVDVAARAAIHRLINNLAAQGTAVLLISSEIEEVLGLAHRVLVMRRGSITVELGADPPMDAVMEAAFGLGGTATT